MINELWLGDALELLDKVPDKSVDLILTDPPYGTIAADWDKMVDFNKMWKQFERIIKPNSAMILTASQPFTTKLINSNIDRFKHSWIWNKKFAGNFCTAKSAPMKVHEDVCVFGLGKINYYPIMIKRDKPIKGGGMSNTDVLGETNFKALKKTYDEKYPTTILDFPREIGRTVHPTQKPVGLFEYLIRTYSKEGDLILDPFAGSGTAGLAAKSTNRNYLLIENNDKYFNLIKQRLGI